MAEMNHNEQVFADFIRETGFEELKADWVLWMLRAISDSNKDGLKINPDWLRAMHRNPNDIEPTMAYEKTPAA